MMNASEKNHIHSADVVKVMYGAVTDRDSLGDVGIGGSQDRHEDIVSYLIYPLRPLLLPLFDLRK